MYLPGSRSIKFTKVNALSAYQDERLCSPCSMKPPAWNETSPRIVIRGLAQGLHRITKIKRVSAQGDARAVACAAAGERKAHHDECACGPVRRARRLGRDA